MLTFEIKKKLLKTIKTCLLYTSDAADERSSVDLGGRRIIKKKGKIGIFAKGIVHDFGQKVEVFSSFVFSKNRSRKSVC